MPFIDSKISVKLSEEQKDKIKTELGKSLPILHKPESYLMVGIDDGYDLYFAGKKIEKGAYVSVSLFGEGGRNEYNTFTEEICRILNETVGIPGDRVYVTYHGVKDWGWDGSLF